VFAHVEVDTRVLSQVEAQVRSIYLGLFAEGDPAFVPRAFGWAEDCFSGRHEDYLPIDARYHDFEHTLQGALCLARLLHGRHRAGAQPALSQRTFELALLAILFHDTGYLKRGADGDGTGAKFTLTHVARGAGFARAFLEGRGIPARDLDAIERMILCTGWGMNVAALAFTDEPERLAGYAVGTADLLGQMAAPDYIEKLPLLFDEFAEAVRFSGAEGTRLAVYESAEDLMQRTPSFWKNAVLPKIQGDFLGLHRFLAEPPPHGPNPYLNRIRDNLAKLERHLAAAVR
jgi:hypothetical protein